MGKEILHLVLKYVNIMLLHRARAYDIVTFSITLPRKGALGACLHLLRTTMLYLTFERIFQPLEGVDVGSDASYRDRRFEHYGELVSIVGNPNRELGAVGK